MSQDRSIPERVVALENSVQSLTAAVSQTNQSIEKTNESIAKLGDYINISFSGLHEKLADKGKPNWSLLITGISVFSGLFFTLLTLRVEPIKSEIASLNTITSMREAALEKQMDKLASKMSHIDALIEWKNHVEGEETRAEIAKLIGKKYKGLGPPAD